MYFHYNHASKKVLSRNMNVISGLKIRAVMFDINILVNNIKSDGIPETKIPKKKYENVKDVVEIDGISTVQSKYVNKVKSKLGGISLLETVASLQNIQSDAQMLNNAKLLKQPSEATKPSRWLLKEGFGDIIDYINNRNIKIILLPIESDLDNSFKTISHLKQQLSDINFQVLDKSLDINKNFDDIQLKLGLKSSNNIMIVSTIPNYLQLAKSKGYYTCKYINNDSNSFYSTEDYKATKPIEIQDAIEDIIGVSYNKSAYSHRIVI